MPGRLWPPFPPEVEYLIQVTHERLRKYKNVLKGIYKSVLTPAKGAIQLPNSRRSYTASSGLALAFQLEANEQSEAATV